MRDSDLSKSKIMNINDFIFRQNLEFYPNLNGLSCEDNILYLKQNGNILDSVALTFDLRTLPGEAWNVNPSEFLNIIRLNKDCKGLYKFLELIEKYAFDPFIKPEYHESEPNEDLKHEIDTNMDRYFKAKDNFHLLTEDNKMLVGKVETFIANLPDNSEIKTLINQKLDNYSFETKSLGDTKSMNIAYDLKQEQALARVRKKEETPYSSRAAFINIAIILYGILNIGFILAVALMK